MNILLINHYAGGPAFGMEFRPHHLAREWVKMGHRVQIVACSFSHVRARNPEMAGCVERAETIDGIDWLWLQAPAYRGNGWGRLLNITVFLARLWRRSFRISSLNRPDVVIASSTYPMDTWVARLIAGRAGCPWIYEVHDLWPQSLIELSGLSPHHPFVRLCGWAERSAYARANGVVSMLPKVHDHMAAKGLDLRKLSIVPNGVVVDDDAPAAALPPTLQAAIDAARAQGCALVGYAGSMGLPNALDTLLDAAGLLRHAPIRFVLVGSGHEQEHLQQRIAREGLTAVSLHGPIGKAQVPAFLHTLTVAYIGWQRVPLYRFGIAPNKLMDYMRAGCPVLHSVQAGNDPVAEAGCGLTVPPGDASAVAEGLQQLLNLPLDERQAMGQRGRAFVLQHHAYPVLARRFLENRAFTLRSDTPTKVQIHDG